MFHISLFHIYISVGISLSFYLGQDSLNNCCPGGVVEEEGGGEGAGKYGIHDMLTQHMINCSTWTSRCVFSKVRNSIELCRRHST